MLTLRSVVQQSGVSFGTSGARGLVASMTSDVCSAYVHAFINAVAVDAEAVVLGHDLRPSSPAVAAACIGAIEQTGRAVIYVGALPTPAVAYYASTLSLPAIIITGSHIPFDRNGIKFYRADGEITKADEAAMLDVQLGKLTAVPPSHELPSVDHAAARAYMNRYTNFFGEGALGGMRVALYEHSSVARDVLRSLLQQLGAEVVSLGRTDTFVPIDTEAVRPEDVAQAKAWAQAHAFDAIVSTDGDADRPLIGDEAGHWLRGDVVGVLCAREVGADVVVTPVSSNTVVERCAYFSEVVRTRIGSPFVIAGMHDVVARSAPGTSVAGYEANGGFLLGADTALNGCVLEALPTRDAVLPILALLASAKRMGRPLSALGDGLPGRYTASDRLQNVPVDKSRALIESLEADLQQAAACMAPECGPVTYKDTTDGLRLTFANGDIVHLRPSGNAPELRCYTEANTSASAEKLCRDCLGRLSAKWQ